MSDKEDMSGTDKGTLEYAEVVVNRYLDKTPGSKALLGLNGLDPQKVTRAFAMGLQASSIAGLDEGEGFFTADALESCLQGLLEGGRTKFIEKANNFLGGDSPEMAVAVSTMAENLGIPLGKNTKKRGSNKRKTNREK